MNQQQAMHSVRKALICAAIEAIEAIPQHGKTYITVMVYDPNAEEKIHFWDTPLEHINNGFITLNVSDYATGYRVFGETELQVSMRFSGRETQLNIPYSLIVSVSALSPDGGVIAGEGLQAFMPYYPEEDTVKPAETAPVEKPAATSQDGNVVSVAFGGNKK
tara:strand:- start:139 stop:624 length:486 start_codon:yes stop_codon:yes gene_type:complete